MLLLDWRLSVLVVVCIFFISSYVSQARLPIDHASMVRHGRFQGQNQHEDGNRPMAAVYRGPVSCDGCAEAVARLLRKSPAKYRVHFLGPDEQSDVTSAALSRLDLFAWPGGGDDQNADYLTVAHYTEALQNYVKNGGKYAGFCLGAFLARGKNSNETFFGLLPNGSYVSSERFEKGAQVSGDKDTIIQVDWKFHTGPKRGEDIAGRWAYFQDGGQIHLDEPAPPNTIIMGRYTATQDPCAVVVPYGSGRVGLVGIHPEADASWYKEWNGSNPDGIKFDIGHDFVSTLCGAFK